MPGTQLFSQWSLREGTRWTPQRLAWVSLLMVWDEGQNLGTRFSHACEFAQDQHPHWKLGRSYSGFTQALVSKSPEIAAAIKARLRQRMGSFPRKFRDRDGFCVLAVDGSRIECPHTRDNEDGLGCAGRDKSAPQVFVTTLWHAHLALPWDFRVGPGTDSERRHLDQMLEDLPEKTLLLADAGFVSFDLCRRLLTRRHSFLLRVGSNLTLLTNLEYDFEQRDDVVSLWPKKKRSLPPLILRLIRLRKNGQTVYLLTDILDKQRLSDEKARALYTLRWGIEVFYRSCKQTLEHRRCLSRTPETCLAEAQWLVLGLWLLGLMTVSTQMRRGLDPRNWSVAQARDVVRRALRPTRPRGRHAQRFTTALAAAVQDSYTRHGPKTARNYPQKKRETPAGPPKIKPATAHEQKLAKQLRSKSNAVSWTA